MSIFKEFSLNSQQISWAIGLILSDAWFKGKWLYLRQIEQRLKVKKPSKLKKQK